MEISKSTQHILEIKGKLYSGNVTEIQRKLEYDLLRFKSLSIVIYGIREIDMSGVFMLYFLKRKAKEKGLELNFVGMDNEVFTSALKFLGVSHIFGKKTAA